MATSLYFVFFLLWATAPRTVQENAPQRDAQALSILRAAVSSMAGTLPADCLAGGDITLIAGGQVDEGAIRIAHRGLEQSAELIETRSYTHRIVYSRGQARETDRETAYTLPLELAVTSQSATLPLPILAAAMSNPDSAFQYVGLESIEGRGKYHIRFWNTFSSVPNMQIFAPFTVRDIWIDAVTGLPQRLSFDQREGQGDPPHISVSVTYADYRSIEGLNVPFLIEKSLNGTLWSTIRIQSVACNTGMTDAAFPVR